MSCFFELLFKNQTLQDSTNKTTDCESVIDSNNWASTKIFIGSIQKHPEDCFTERNRGKIYRNTCCAACRSGQWIDRQVNTCIDCEAGHQCPSSLDVSQNGPCDAGTYQPKPRKTSCKGSGISVSSNAYDIKFDMNVNKPVKRLPKRHELYKQWTHAIFHVS